MDQKIRGFLRRASRIGRTHEFTCRIFQPPWNEFVESWAPVIYGFVLNALGPYGVEPLADIHLLHDGQHSAGATASFDLSTGQVSLASSVEGKAGQTLEKLTHEFTHGALAEFPEGDPFYEEGFVDYSVWVMAHAPVWGEHRDAMIQAADLNIRNRRDRALMDQSDYDRKRWAGGVFAMVARGPHIVASLKSKKQERNFTW
jgi:hypothetical protein